MEAKLDRIKEKLIGLLGTAVNDSYWMQEAIEKAFEPEWEPEENEQVIAWDNIDFHASVVCFSQKSYPLNSSGSIRVCVAADNIAKFEDKHFQQSLKIEDIENRGVIMYERGE